MDEIETKKIIKNKQRRTTSVRFMYVGALIENKGIKNLINAFLNVKIKDVSLHIYGEGELKQYIYENSQKDRRIIYHGQLTSDKLKSEWIANDVLIVPSIWEEPFGRVIIEGNQFGLPVIGSNRGGIVEIINNIKTGELFDFKSIEDLTNKIIQFSNRKYIKQYYPAIIHNLKKYSISYQVGEFENVYHEIIGGDDYNEQ